MSGTHIRGAGAREYRRRIAAIHPEKRNERIS